MLGASCIIGVCPDHAKYDLTKSTKSNAYPADAKIEVGTVSNTAQAFPVNDNIQASYLHQAKHNERVHVHPISGPEPNIDCWIVDKVLS